tara:strand:- start:34909 stop:35073 length:165 start_codon:yes stop_codon:yes gene_type:complete
MGHSGPSSPSPGGCAASSSQDPGPSAGGCRVQSCEGHSHRASPGPNGASTVSGP